MSDTPIDSSKRTWLIATGCAGAVGGVATAVPFVSYFSAIRKGEGRRRCSRGGYFRAQAGRKSDGGMARKARLDLTPHAGSAGRIAQARHASWPTRSRKRKPDEFTPAYARNGHRSIKPEYSRGGGYLPASGLLAHRKILRGAQPSLPDDWKGGFLCPCHGSTFDMAGRVYKNKPSPDNLEVPPHMYLSDTRLLIGDDKKA